MTIKRTHALKKWVLLYGLMGLLFGVLIFFKLGKYSLWQDEADQALLSLSILKTGLPLALQDGKFITQWHGQESTARYLWYFNPWLPLYLAAGSFKLFGVSEWAARFPFALFGFLSLLPLGIVFWKWAKNHAVAWLALFLFAANPWVILYMRQAKYFGIVFFAYGLMLLSRKWLYALGFVLLFHCNYLAALLSAAGLVLYARKKSFLFLNLFLFAVFCLPFFFVGSMESRLSMTSHWPTLGQYFTKLGTHIFYFNRQVVPLILAPLWIFWWHKENWFRLIATAVLTGWIGVALLNYDVLRYNLQLIPLFCFLMAATLARLFQKNKILGLALLSLFFGVQLRGDWGAMKNYYFRDYADPPKIIPRIVQEKMRPGESVYLNNNQPVWQFYSDIPLAYQVEPLKTPLKTPPLQSAWSDIQAIDWWIGPDLVKLGNGPYLSEEEIKTIWDEKGLRHETIDSGISILNWGLNSPIRYKHFLARFAEKPEPPGSIQLIHRLP